MKCGSDIPSCDSPCPTFSFPRRQGEGWFVLHREFCSYLVDDPDGFSRRVLMFMANSLSGAEHYMQARPQAQVYSRPACMHAQCIFVQQSTCTSDDEIPWNPLE